MAIPYDADQLVDAARDVVRSSGLAEAYVRPLAYYGYGEMGLSTAGSAVQVSIACWAWTAPLAHTADRGARLKVSSWIRPDHNSMPPAAKTTGNYVNSALARAEAHRAGYDEAVMLNRHGLVAECSAENLFCGRRGVLTTPPTVAGALDGITRDSIMTLAHELGIPVVIGDLARSDLYAADELLTCGTSAEVAGVSSVDDREIPYPGPYTSALADAYAAVVRGGNDLRKDWLTLV
jgi:branched-chain amino acid aminotransferase